VCVSNGRRDCERTKALGLLELIFHFPVLKITEVVIFYCSLLPASYKNFLLFEVKSIYYLLTEVKLLTSS